MIGKLLDVIVGWLAAGSLFLLVSAAGGLLPVASRDDRTLAMRWAARAAAGVVLLYVWLLVLDRLGIAWTRLSVLVPLLVAAIFGLRRMHRVPVIVGGPRRPGAAELIVLAAFAVLAFLLVRPCLTMPDVVFHWGIKAQRYVLGGGIDYAFLTREWNFNKHADYPNLVPGLYAVGAILRGRFSEAILLPWTLAYAALIVVAARESFRGRESFRRRIGWFRKEHPGARATLVVVTLSSLAFAIDYMLGGSPDLLFGGLVAVAIPAVLGRAGPGAAGSGRDWQVSVFAAVAAGAKYEGGPLAAILILARLWQRRRTGASIGPRVWLRLATLPAIVAGLWWIEVLGRGLAQGNRAGGFDVDRWHEVGSGVLRALGSPAWHGFAWVLLAMPLLLLVRALRPMAWVVCAQAAVYLWVYFTTPLDVTELIATSAERLLVHLVPATLILFGLAFAGVGRRSDRDTMRP